MIFPNTLRRPSSYVLAGLGAVAVGSALGYGIAHLPLLIYLAVAGASLNIAWLFLCELH